MVGTGVTAAAEVVPPLDTGLSADLVPLLRELGDLKRLHSAKRAGSTAERLFADGWAMLMSGQPVEAVTDSVTATALAAARLGDLGFATLVDLGLDQEQAIAVLADAIDAVAGGLQGGQVTAFKRALGNPPRQGSLPSFVAALARQPRAGVTCPGKPRLMLQPAENHAEHCLTVAVYGALLAPFYGARPATVFLCGMAHHLHSAAMPDSGFTGEVLLGEHLMPVIDRARRMALQQLPPSLRAEIERVLPLIDDDATAEGRAFHAADVLDRVLEIEQHLRAATATMDQVLIEYELVHDGPVKPFHDQVLREVGLL